MNDDNPIHEDNEMTERDVTERSALGENTLVRLSFVLGFLLTFGSAVWWASGIQSDLNAIKISLAHVSNVDTLESRVKMLEMYGTPKTLELEKELRNVEKEFELHKALSDSLKNK